MEDYVNDISYQKYLFHQGENFQSYKFLGAFPIDGGVLFRVWAPRARSISLVCNQNGWDIHADPFKRLPDDSTIWEVTVPGMGIGDIYKFVVEDVYGNITYKSDPYALETEKGPMTEQNQMASRVSARESSYEWKDAKWLAQRKKTDSYRSPMNIYEVHLGSWKRHFDGSYYSYHDLAEELIPYAKEMGYTHIEILPVTEYPYDPSWGYQVTGYYSVTSRYGTPDDFRYFVDKAHQEGIGVIMDWVPAHFPKDSQGLINFDGEPLYEDSNPFRMEHKGWGTRAFDFGRPEVLCFLISNAQFFCEQYHIDGLRVDAIAAMLYLDYDRKDGEWQQNQYGGRENIEAIHFLRKMNEYILSNFPGVLTIAEESTAWPMVTKPPKDGGLGFNYKWNMGWMNDTLDYFKNDPLWRGAHHNQLTFAMTYAHSENFILPISHDEVVHMKRSLLDKMPGNYDEKFDGVRSFFVYFMTHPGKKLSFMGNEFGQFIEWNEAQGLDWLLLDYDKHKKLHDFVHDLNRLYQALPQLWSGDDTWDGFRWIDADNYRDSVYTYYREDPYKKREKVLIALNLSGLDFEEYDIGVPEAPYYRCIIDSDFGCYGGRGIRKAISYRVKKGDVNGFEQHITIPLPARSGIILISGKESSK
ncbi:MAG: 1,4-alpha-glucan branching protein GlgB [Clostridia bacterium]|nr:1,4-alpha-glucan branching protein GlgB [Clostridia bacterium]